MGDKSQAMKKIQFQMNKKNKATTDVETRKEIVEGLLRANISKEDNTIIQSEMPKDIMGIEVDWNTLETKIKKK